jgi:hypothetical protein
LCVVRWSSSRRLSSSRSFQWWPAPSLRSSRCPHRSPSIGISCVRPSPFPKLHLREEFGDWGEPTTSGQSSFRLSGAGLPFQPHRRAVLVVSHDLDRFAALVCLIIVPRGPRTEPWFAASPQLASVPVGLPRAACATEVVLADADLSNIALQAYFILQPIMGFAVFQDGDSASPLT